MLIRSIRDLSLRELAAYAAKLKAEMALITDKDGNILSGISVPVTNTGAANAAVTLTIVAPPAGQYVYLTGLWISRAGAAALAGTAALVITSTNLPGNPAWSVGNACPAGGTMRDVEWDIELAPIKAAAPALAVTIVAPAPGAGVLWRLNALYFYAP